MNSTTHLSRSVAAAGALTTAAALAGSAVIQLVHEQSSEWTTHGAAEHLAAGLRRALPDGAGRSRAVDGRPRRAGGCSRRPGRAPGRRRGDAPAAYWLTAALAEEWPLLLVVDDAH